MRELMIAEMRELISTNIDNNGIANLQCPTGKRVRLLGFRTPVGSGAQGEQFTIAFSRGSSIRFATVTNPAVTSITSLCAGLGCDHTTPMIDSQTVATGVNNYNTTQSLMGAPLPDIWWNHEVTVQITGPTATFGPGSALYERDDA